MSNLTFLNDASVLYVLRARYSAMLIYVSFLYNIGSIAIIDVLWTFLCCHQPLQASSYLHRLCNFA